MAQGPRFLKEMNQYDIISVRCGESYAAIGFYKEYKGHLIEPDLAS
jgi:hypothetical protein